MSKGTRNIHIGVNTNLFNLLKQIVTDIDLQNLFQIKKQTNVKTFIWTELKNIYLFNLNYYLVPVLRKRTKCRLSLLVFLDKIFGCCCCCLQLLVYRPYCSPTLWRTPHLKLAYNIIDNDDGDYDNDLNNDDSNDDGNYDNDHNHDDSNLMMKIINIMIK